MRVARIFPLKVMGFWLFVRACLVDLIYGYVFMRFKNGDQCAICGKSLDDRRFELSVDLPSLNYETEFDKFLCIDHAILTLLTYRRKFNE